MRVAQMSAGKTVRSPHRATPYMHKQTCTTPPESTRVYTSACLLQQVRLMRAQDCHNLMYYLQADNCAKSRPTICCARSRGTLMTNGTQQPIQSINWNMLQHPA